MFSRKTIILECTDSRVAAGWISERKGRVQVEHHAEESWPPGASGDGGVSEMSAAFQRLRARLGRPGPCVLVLPAHFVLTKFLAVPRVDPVQRAKVIQFESEQRMPVALSELVWDSVVAGERTGGLEVMLAGAHRDRVEALCAAARAAGLTPELVLPPALATLAAFRMVRPQAERPAVVMNVGARSTTFLWVEPARFLARSLGFSITAEAAGAQGIDATKLAARLTQELARTVLSFRAESEVADPAEVWLTGNSTLVPNLHEALASRLGLPVAPLDLGGTFDVPGGAGNSGDGGQVTAELIGAAAIRIKDGQARLNLLPVDPRRRSTARQRIAIAAAALTVTAIMASLLPQFRARETRGAVPSRFALASAPVDAAMTESAAVEVVAPTPRAADDDDSELIGELLAVQREPYRLQLAGYFGRPGNYVGAFIGRDNPETLLARGGERFDGLEVAVKSFEVRRDAAGVVASTPAGDEAGFAVVADERSGDEVVLDTRVPALTAQAQAIVRLAGEEGPVRTFREGDVFSGERGTYRVERIQLSPPEVIVARQTADGVSAAIQTLRPAGAAELGP